MTHQLGTHFAGIRDLAAIKLRCYCDRDTGCWHWRGTTGKRPDRQGREPMLWLADERRTTTIMRGAWAMAGKVLKPGHIVWRRCRSHDCANPAHMMAGTRADWGAWVARCGHLRGRPERPHINRRNVIESGRTTITMELAQWVRESPQTGRDVAHALDVPETPISRIRTGKTFRRARVASVFAMGVAMNDQAMREAA
jgi:hypothetical protein